MKKGLSLLSIIMLVTVGCSKPETKLPGKWESQSVKGFVAEFNKDHTGTTSVAAQGHAGTITAELSKLPFQWTVLDDGRIKITEGKTVYFGRLAGSKLELEVNGAKTVLEKKTK